MLTGIEEALSELNQLRQHDRFQLVAVYGRRGVGRSRLLREFASSVERIFFICGEVNSTLMLRSFSKVLLSHFGAQERFEEFDSWKKAIRFIPYMAEDKPVVIVIENYMNLFNAVPSFALNLKRLIESELHDSRLFIVLSGSFLDLKRSGFASGDNPLSSCLTACVELKPLDYLQIARLLGNLRRDEIVTVAGILGGMPEYLAKWDAKLSVEENIVKNFLDPSAFLYNQPQAILRDVIREPQLYNSILQTIATGADRLSEIAKSIGESSDKTAKYIATLIDLDLLVREIPVTEETRSRKAIYRINDYLSRFWYTFISPNLTAIESGGGNELVHELILPGLEEYLRPVFVKICMHYMKALKDAGRFEGEIERIGGWWTNDEAKDGRIDILCMGRDLLIASDCYWKGEAIGIESLEKLVAKARKIKARNKRYMLFSRRGFNEELRAYALNNAKVTLVDLHGLFEVDFPKIGTPFLAGGTSRRQ